MYRHLNVTGNLNLINLDRFKLTTDPKKGAEIFEFYNGDRWVPLTKQTGNFFAPKTLRDRFGGVNTMKNFLGVAKTSPSLEKSLKAATRLSRELPTDIEMETMPHMELSFLVDDIRGKTREASQNTDLDMRELLGTNKALQSIQGELLNNTSKLTEIDKRIKRDTKKFQEVENDPTYSDEQKQLCKDRLDDLNTEKQTRLEILSQNRKELQIQVARIKQTLEKVLDQNTSLAERIRNQFCEQGFTIASVLTVFSMTISTIILAITGVFGGGSGGTGGSPRRHEGGLKKWLDKLANALKRLAGKVVEALPAILRSVVSAILSFLGKTVGFVEHTWDLIIFVAGLIGVWLMQKVKKS